MLQQRAKAAIEGAKERHVARENQRLADLYVHRLIRRIAVKLNWVEEERRERERHLRKAFPWVVPDRPSRRRDRKRESRHRHVVEYEEVPGGGQFLMMMLSRNRGAVPQTKYSRELGDAPDSEGNEEEGVGAAMGIRGVNKHANDPAIRDDPAVLHAEVATPWKMRAIAKVGGKALQMQPKTQVFTQNVTPSVTSSSSAEHEGAMRNGNHTSQKLPGRAHAVTPKRQGASIHEFPRGVRPQRTVSSQGPVTAPPAFTAKQEWSGRRAAAQGIVLAHPGGNASHGIEALLRVAGLDEKGSNEPAHESRDRHVSKASSKIFGKLQAMMCVQEGPQPAVSPVIPLMPDVAAIWSPTSGPMPNPYTSPWASQLPSFDDFVLDEAKEKNVFSYAGFGDGCLDDRFWDEEEDDEIFFSEQLLG